MSEHRDETEGLEAAAGNETPAEGQSPVLRALTASAMALPGMPLMAGGAAADGPVEETTIDQSFSYYKEDDLPPHKVPGFGAERDRYEIYTYQFRVTTPVPKSERMDVDAELILEDMSGASPWFVLPSASNPNKPVQVMSGSTIDDQRGDLLVKANRYYDWGKLSGSLGGSVENDYYAFNMGFGGEHHFNENNTTLSAGLGASFDWIEPENANKFQGVGSSRPQSDTKQSYSIYGGISQVLSHSSAIQSTLSFTYNTGFLSDPYKLAWLVDPGMTVRDKRPNTRRQITWQTRYRKHFSGWNATAHLDYKLYSDSWEVNSHTFDIAWYQTVYWPNFQIVPSFRYYTQSQADFYEVFYATLPENRRTSSDYRLSPYGAISYKIKAELEFEDLIGHSDWLVSASYERYSSSASYGLSSVDVENPGLVDFNLFSGRIAVKF